MNAGATFSGYASLPQGGAKPSHIVWLMHGCGGTGASFAQPLEHSIRVSFPNAAIYAPDGKLASQDGGYQHFDIETHYSQPLFSKEPSGWNAAERSRMEHLRKGVEQNAKDVNAQIDALLAGHGLADSNVVMLGYSQGGQSVLHAAFHREKPVAAVASVFGSLLAPEALERDITARPPALLVGSATDTVLTAKSTLLAAQFLKAASVCVQTITVPDADHHADWQRTITETALPALCVMAATAPIPRGAHP